MVKEHRRAREDPRIVREAKEALKIPEHLGCDSEFDNSGNSRPTMVVGTGEEYGQSIKNESPKEQGVNL